MRKGTRSPLVIVSITRIFVESELRIGAGVDTQITGGIGNLVYVLHRHRHRENGTRAEKPWDRIDGSIRLDRLTTFQRGSCSGVVPEIASGQIDLARVN